MKHYTVVTQFYSIISKIEKSPNDFGLDFDDFEKISLFLIKIRFLENLNCN